ncbi:MAG TPA: C4-type zinc ribbon domain-containing protein [Methanothrix soehngenii]|nr:C4-type zinc ribbon domain-containing protein [Methanothrix soehngenii]
MKEGIDILYRLQQKDDRARELDQEIASIPARIQSLEDERDSRTQMIAESKSRLEANRKERDALEKSILHIKENIKKRRDQLSKATTNQEYQGLNAEIRHEGDRIQGVEEKIIEKMVEADLILEEVRTRESEFAAIAEGFNQQIQVHKDTIRAKEEEKAGVIEARDLLRGDASPQLLKTYDLLATKRAGKALAVVQDGFCGACNVKIRPQILSVIPSTSDLLTCENCGRILYAPPLEQVLSEQESGI